MIISTKSRKKTKKRASGRGTSLQQRFQYKLDLIFLITVFVFALPFLTFTYSNNIQTIDPILIQLANKALIAMVLLFAGLFVIIFITLHFLLGQTKRVEIQYRFIGFGRGDFQRLFLALAVGTFGISVFNFLLFSNVNTPRFDITGFDILLFSVTMAIIEEVIFTFLFQVLMVFVFKSIYAGIVIRPTAFVIYHLFVYSNEPLILFSVFIVGLVLAITFQLTRNVSSNLLIHVFINAMPVILPAILEVFTALGGG